MRAIALGVVLTALSGISGLSAALAQDSAVHPNAHVLDPIVVTARAPRPHAMIFLRRAPVRFDTPDRTAHSSVDRIAESVRHDPF